jgi:hypothetical protein
LKDLELVPQGEYLELQRRARTDRYSKGLKARD